MKLKTCDFQKTCSTVLLAVDNKAANLEIWTDKITNELALVVSNKEYYCKCTFPVSEVEQFHATVDANLFLDLIAGITSDEIDLALQNNTIIIKANKSTYKLPMIYENNVLLTLPEIVVTNPTVEMNISNDILSSIFNVNGKEIQKVSGKCIGANELNKLYYITETGCLTVTTCACLNEFTLEQPVRLLLTDQIIKLFKLFKTDVQFKLGYVELQPGLIQTRVSFKNDSVYVAAITSNTDHLLAKLVGPFEATKHYLQASYAYSVVLSAAALRSAVARLMTFMKRSNPAYNPVQVLGRVHISGDDFVISDPSSDNNETVTIENESIVSEDYEMVLNLVDLKTILDSCKMDHITLNCGDHRIVVISRGPVKNIISEGSMAEEE